MEDQKLILFVQQYPQLYDIQHEHYADDLLRQNIWKEIGGKMGVTADECQNRWTHILNNNWARFEKELEFLKDHTAGPGQTISMVVLEVRPAATITSEMIPEEVNAEPSAPEISEIVPNELLNPQPIAREIVQEQVNAEPSVSESHSSEESSGEDVAITRNRNSRKRKRCSCCCSEAIRDYFVYKLQRLRSRREKDDIDYFIAHIEEAIRDLPPLLQWDAKREITNIIRDLEYRVLTSGYDEDFETDE